MKQWKRISVILMVILFALGTLAGCAGSGETGGGEDKVINIGYVTWAENIANTNLWKEILETKGYEVNISQLQVSPLFVGLSNGDLDFFMDAWLPITHETYWEEYQDDLEDYGVWYEEQARIGIVVPDYVTIDKISEIAENAGEFDGQIIGIDPGAGIMGATQAAMEDLGMDSITLVQGSEAAMMAALDNAVKEGKWVAITGWSPHWKFAKYDLKYLEDDSPNQSFGAAENIHTLAHKDFEARQPEVAGWIRNFSMSDQQIGSLEDYINQTPDDPQGAARKWIADNQEVVDAWLAE